MERPGTAGKVVVTGMCCYVPIAGVLYQVLHYLIGLRTLGYDAYYVEQSDRWPYDRNVQVISADATPNVAILAAAMSAHGFGDRWAFTGDYEGGRHYGMDEEKVRRLYREADALVNVTGQQLHGDQFNCRRRIYVETDPFASQVRVSQGDPAELARLQAHDIHFSFGENLGGVDCLAPIGEFDWLPTRQPVAIELWERLPGVASSGQGRALYTTVTTWSNAVEGIVYDGETYHWQKNYEFERFLDLPLRSSAKFEVAATVDDDVKQLLASHGWLHVTSERMSTDLALYRGYIRNSRAEFTVARDQYVRPRTGWFSDRSACYLASGRPVITQDTAFDKFVPTGEGLFKFSTIEEILAAVDEIESDYERHSAAAHSIAKDFFAAERVVGSLMERAGV